MPVIVMNLNAYKSLFAHVLRHYISSHHQNAFFLLKKRNTTTRLTVAYHGTFVHYIIVSVEKIRYRHWGQRHLILTRMLSYSIQHMGYSKYHRDISRLLSRPCAKIVCPKRFTEQICIRFYPSALKP